MNKNISLFSYVFRTLILTFCVLLIPACRDTVEETPGDNSLNENGKDTVNISIVLDSGIKTREDNKYSPDTDFAEPPLENNLFGNCDITKGKEINILFYKVFELDSNGNPIVTDNEPERIVVTDISKTEISLLIDRTLSYKILFWAQHVKKEDEDFTSPYSLTSEMDVEVNYNNIRNNDERLDAFYGSLDYDWKAGITPTSVTLYRPFAQVNIGSIIADWLPSGFYNKKLVKSKMTVSSAAKKFSILSGKVVNGSSVNDVVFHFNEIFNGPTQEMEYLEPEEIAKLSFKRAFLYVDFNENGEIDPSPTTSPGNNETENNSGLVNNNVDWWRYERSRYISMAYFLVDSEESMENASDVVDVRFEIGYVPTDGEFETGNVLELPYREMIFDNVAVRPNFRTNIVGALFSKQQRIYVNLSPVFDGDFITMDGGPWDFERLDSPEKMLQEGFTKLIGAFYANNDNDINELFQIYGCPETNYFVLAENVTNNTSQNYLLQIRWDYILYGNANTVKLKINNNSGPFGGKEYFNMGQVRNLYITDLNGNNKIYIDDYGFVWIDKPGVGMVNSWNKLQEIDGSYGKKSYDVCASTGEVKQSNFYPPTYN